MIALGQTARVPVIDLEALSLALWDNTHFQAHGAIEVARLVARVLRQQRIMPRGSLVRLNRAIPDSALVWPAEIPA